MEQNKKTAAAIIAVLVFVVIAWVVLSSVLTSYHKENFKIRVQHTLSTYGDQISNHHVDGTIVIIDVNPVMWRNTDELTRESWMKEIVALIKLDAEDSELLFDSSIRVSFYDNPNSKDSVASYRIDKK